MTDIPCSWLRVSGTFIFRFWFVVEGYCEGWAGLALALMGVTTYVRIFVFD